MNEGDLLRHIYARSRDLHGRLPILLGPGDDCAVLAPEGPVVVGVDQLVAGRHFDPDTTPVDLIARKAIARSVSDIGAMGARPFAALATGCLPSGFDDADELFDRMAHWASVFECPLVGGDIATSEGPLVLTVTTMGAPREPRAPVLRSQARQGDSVCVTGAFGASFESGHHLSFDPRLVEGQWLCEMLGDDLGAMIDVSDGLGLDASRIARASGLRMEIDSGSIPLHEGVTDWRRGAGDGEDYELCFTVRAGVEVPTLCTPTRVPITRIGEVMSGQGCAIRTAGGETIDASDMGWEHRG